MKKVFAKKIAIALLCAASLAFAAGCSSASSDSDSSVEDQTPAAQETRGGRSLR